MMGKHLYIFFFNIFIYIYIFITDQLHLKFSCKDKQQQNLPSVLH